MADAHAHGTDAHPADLAQVPLMVQTEDNFSSLPLAAVALLRMHLRHADPDLAALVTGDCFALQIFPDQGVSETAGYRATLQEGMQDLGFPAKLISTHLTAENRMRVFAIMRAALVNARAVLVCGGWSAETAASRPDAGWGIINKTHPEEPRFIGSTLQGSFLGGISGQDVPWPHEGGAVHAVYLVEGWRDPGLPPARLARRSLQRGISLLAGDRGIGGTGEHARLLQCLTALRGGEVAGSLGAYPYPALAATRCRLEALARVMRRVNRVVPRRKHTICKRAIAVCSQAAQLLLDHEPPRSHPRTDAAAVGSGRPPWPLAAWEERARALANGDAESVRREIALVEELRGAHAELVGALDALLDKR